MFESRLQEYLEYIPIRPTDKVKKETKRNKKKKSASLTVFTTIILSICLFITSFFAIMIFEIRNILKEENAEALFNNIKISEILDSDTINEPENIKRFHNYMKDRQGIEIDNQNLDNFIKNSTVKTYIARKIAYFSEDFFNDEAELKITKEEIAELLENNSDIIKNEFGRYLSYNDIEKITDFLFEDEEIVILNSDTLKDTSPLLYYAITFGLSYVNMAVLIFLSILIIFFMIKNTLSQAVCGIGIDFIIFGGLSGLIAVTASLFGSLWKSLCNQSIVGTIVGNFMSAYTYVSVIFLLIGIILLISRRLVIKRRAKAQK